jgi:DNA-directed RNA polymerase II subunit RPB7
MYFLTTLQQNIYLAPIYLNKDYKNFCLSSLLATVEGKKISSFGIVIIVLEFNKDFKNGKFLPGSSSALFLLKYKALTLKIFKGEILDAIVTNITKLGFFCEMGMVQIFVAKQFIPSSYFYNSKSNNFICKRLKRKISSEIIIRIRIIGVRDNCDHSQAIGSIKESNLGPLD